MPKRRVVSDCFYSNPTIVYDKNYSMIDLLIGVSTVPKKKKLGKMGPMIEKKILPVETDPQKLVQFVCGSNINKTGEDIVLKPDSEYPDWLWTLRTGPPPPLEELDPESKEYWRRIRSLGMKRNNKLSKLKKF